MRAKKKNQKTTLLVTDDPALDSAARDIAKELGDDLQRLKDNQEATCTAFDAPACETFAIVDADTSGARRIINTISGLMPVIAVSAKPNPWLRSMLRRHRIHAQVSKPVARETLKKAVFQIRDFHGNDASFGQ